MSENSQLKKLEDDKLGLERELAQLQDCVNVKEACKQ